MGNSIMTKNFLLEINVEELPLAGIENVYRQMPSLFRDKFTSLDINFGETFIGITKNRLLFYIKDVSIKQNQKPPKKVFGPPKSISLDKDGNFTVQALGFAKAQQVKPIDLRFEKTDKGEYLAVEKKQEARMSKHILREIIPEAINGLHFTKTMKWDSSGLRFARPILSIMAVFGNESVNVKMGNAANKKIRNITAEKYFKNICASVNIDPDKRREEIKNLVFSGQKKLNAMEYIEPVLLDEVVFMVDSPNVFTGDFDAKYLELPEDVLKASMAKYQRIFPVLKKDGLVNKFIAVIDGKGRDVQRVRKNYENILEARLKDSLFFFKEDVKRPLDGYAPQLKNLIFQKDLGNMSEKIARLKELCGFICSRLNIDNIIKSDIVRAAELSKLDLVTHMVGEFPSLQGIMGMHYAIHSKEKSSVANAIKEHYLPQGIEDDIPQSIEGAVLSISDKIDNVAGFLGIGIDVSGSFDPYGIRRNTQGFIQIIKNKGFRFNIEEVITFAVSLYGGRLTVPEVELKKKILNYIKERMEWLIVFGKEKVQKELVEAVLAVEDFDIVGMLKRVSVFSEISRDRYFLEAAKVVERTHNILKGAKKEKIEGVNEQLFKEDLERELWRAYLSSKDKIEELTKKEKYKEATKEYSAAFFEIMHKFFDSVMVNVEDMDVRLNRLAMMKAINILYTKRIADLARLPQIVVE